MQFYLILPAKATVEILSDTGYILEITPDGYFPSLKVYEVVAEVKNVGEVAVHLVNVTVTFYYSNGEVIANSTGSPLIKILLPGRKAPFHTALLPEQARPEDVDHYSLDVKFREYQDVLPLGLEIISNSSYLGEDGTLYINGLIKNTQNTKATNVRVVSTFYDAEGNIVAVSPGGPPFDIEPGQSKQYKVPLLPQRVPYVYSYSLTAESDEYAIVSELGPFPIPGAIPHPTDGGDTNTITDTTGKAAAESPNYTLWIIGILIGTVTLAYIKWGKKRRRIRRYKRVELKTEKATFRWLTKQLFPKNNLLTN